MSGRTLVLAYPSIVIDGSGAVVPGGAEIYLSELAVVAKDLGYRVVLAQCGAQSERRNWNGVDVRTIHWRPSLLRRKPAGALRRLLAEFDPCTSLVVFGSEGVACELPDGWRSLLIQHGIGFDYPTSGRSLGPLKLLRSTGIAQSLVRRGMVQAARCVDLVVCVDHVYPTWLTTFDFSMRQKLLTITNFARLPGPRAYQRTSRPRILFARRLVERRGALLMADAIRLLRQRGLEFEATFAGDGDMEGRLKAAMRETPGVEFTSYPRERVQEIHAAHDIAVVPSLASEGTSFSLLEAMAAGCAVVATSIGGLTNIVIDGHNGLLCEPNPEALADAIERLVLDPELSARLAQTGYETVEHSFGFDRWRMQWKRAFDRVFAAG